MLLLDKFTGLFTNRPSTHSPDPPQPTPHSPPSDATSDQIQRAQASGERIPAIESGTTPVQLDGVSSSAQDDPHRYAKESRTPHPDSRSVRTLAPAGQTVPARGSGMNRSSRKPSSAKEEARLFPTYTCREPGDGVPIVPFVPSRSKSKANVKNFGPRPIDRISSKARDSGPVRAQGKAKEPPRFTSPTLSLPHSPYDGQGLDRPAKRQRRDSSDGGVIPLLSDDEMAPPSATGMSVRRSSHSSQPSSRARKSMDPLHYMSRGINEFRDVERGVKPPRTPTKRSKTFHHTAPDDDDDCDEKFTENAAKERRRRVSIPDKAPKPPSVLTSVEVPAVDRKASPTRHVPESPSRDMSSPEAKKKRSPRTSRRAISKEKSPPRGRATKKKERKRSPDDVESPDELQGEATVQRAPSFLARESLKNPTEATAIVVSDDVDLHVQSGSENQSTISKTISQRKEKSGKSKAKSKKGAHIFDAVFFLAGQHVLRPTDRKIELEVDDNTHMLKVDSTNSDASHKFSVPLKKITCVVKGDNPSQKVSLQMPKTGTEDPRIGIEFSSMKEKDDFCDFLKTLNIKVQLKESEWMDKMFIKREQNLSFQRNARKRPSESGDSKSDVEVTPLQNPVTSKRQKKLADSLQDYAGLADPPLRPTAKHRGSSLPENTQPASSNEDNAVDIPVKKYTPDASLASRATRSMSRREQPATVVCDDDDDVLPTPTPKGKVQKWHRPLVYPRFGKKKAEVGAHDLERLRESEFLNDNLIGFYIRFLEDHLARSNEEVAKRVYFFNSYFFATLTNFPRGQKGINYEGVEKWTRNVNLFNHDYIVVPINENAHWYVAIICNLPELQRISKPAAAEEEATKEASNEAEKEDKSPSAQSDGEPQEVPETPELSQEPSFNKESQDLEPPKEETTRKRLASMSLSDTELPHDSNPPIQPIEPDWPTQEENPTSSPTKFSSPARKTVSARMAEAKGSPAPKGSPKKQNKPKRKTPFGKFDANAPTIITFDSLDANRSPTIRTLREYLEREAMSKQGLKIDARRYIKGMRAQAIPLQSNYSDCGLYLLAYMEKFVQDPDTFVRKLLQKEMNREKDWPRLRPGLLRTRLRNFLDDLYDEQTQLTPQQANEKTLMVDQQPINHLLGASDTRRANNSETDDRKSLPPRCSRSPADEPDKSRLESTGADSNQSSMSDEANSDVARKPHSTAQSGPSDTEKASPEVNGAPNKPQNAPDTSTDVVVEVPDSQEQDKNHLPLPPPSPFNVPSVVISRAVISNPRRKASKPETAASVEGEKAHSREPDPEIVLESDTEPTAKLSTVEIPVPQQSASLNSSTSRSTGKVSRSHKHKSKHASD